VRLPLIEMGARAMTLALNGGGARHQETVEVAVVARASTGPPREAPPREAAAREGLPRDAPPGDT
jgi:hypothetical protein